MSLDLGRALKDIAMKSKMVDYSIRCPHQKISYLQPSIGFVDQKTGLIKHIDLKRAAFVSKHPVSGAFDVEPVWMPRNLVQST